MNGTLIRPLAWLALLVARPFMAGGAINGRLYVVGGLPGGTTHEAYTP
jgi:hypothetical protein